MEVARTFLADNAAAPPQSFPVLGFFPEATLEPPPKTNLALREGVQKIDFF